MNYNMNYTWFHANEAWDMVMNQGVQMTHSYDWDWPRVVKMLDAVDLVFPEEEGTIDTFKTKEEFVKEFADETFRVI
jgi:hypothetical protein